MGFLNEFPHVESNKFNLDWLLEQYRTFNDRIAEIQAHFDEVAEEMRQENAQYKADMLSAFNSFKNDIDEQVATISNAIEQVSDNVSEFVEEHMDEWQLDSMIDENHNVIIGDYDPEEPIADGGRSNSLIINNTEIVYNDFGINPFFSPRLFNITDAELEAGSGAKQLGSDITASNTVLYPYFTQKEEEYGLDENNCIDYIFPIIAKPANWGASVMSDFANNPTYLSGIRVQKASNTYKMQISFATSSHTLTANGLYYDIYAFLPYQ